MRKALAVSVLISSQFVWAQIALGQRGPSPSGDDSIADRRIQLDAFEKWVADAEGVKKKAEAAKASEAAREFYSKAHQFVELWEAFAAQLNQRKTFNAKLAKQVSKAFHDLEKSDGWPVGRTK